jgi:hypothetical protein
LIDREEVDLIGVEPIKAGKRRHHQTDRVAAGGRDSLANKVSGALDRARLARNDGHQGLVVNHCDERDRQVASSSQHDGARVREAELSRAACNLLNDVGRPFAGLDRYVETLSLEETLFCGGIEQSVFWIGKNIKEEFDLLARLSSRAIG